MVENNKAYPIISHFWKVYSLWPWTLQVGRRGWLEEVEWGLHGNLKAKANVPAHQTLKILLACSSTMAVKRMPLATSELNHLPHSAHPGTTTQPSVIDETVTTCIKIRMR